MSATAGCSFDVALRLSVGRRWTGNHRTSSATLFTHGAEIWTFGLKNADTPLPTHTLGAGSAGDEPGRFGIDHAASKYLWRDRWPTRLERFEPPPAIDRRDVARVGA